MKTMELSLPEELHSRILKIAKDAGKPAKEVVRQAISAGLALRQRESLRQAISKYAREHAGSRQDLDVELESASLECLRSSLADQE